MPMGKAHNHGSRDSGVYAPRRPQRTVLYEVVCGHLETFLQLGVDPLGDSVPAYIEQTFRKYLACEILAHGFARARCECGYNILIPFSCKGRAICTSCNAKRMVATAAKLVDNVFPKVPVRQWVLTVPKRLRYFLLRDPKLAGVVLRILLRTIEVALRAQCTGAPDNARAGAASFLQRFGSTLNAHLHYHCCLMDGIFASDEDGALQFYPAAPFTPGQLSDLAEIIRRKILKYFKRRGLLDPESAEGMLNWPNSGFSLDASVRIEAEDRAGLERLLRYCARPPFASENLSWQTGDKDALIYRSPKPTLAGQTSLTLTPLELIEKLVGMLPPPRNHQVRYFGVLAPNCPLRVLLVDLAGQDPGEPGNSRGQEDLSEPDRAGDTSTTGSHRTFFCLLWALLIARIYLIDPLECPRCNGPMRIIAFVTANSPVKRILAHLGEPTEPPVPSPARGPPGWEAVADIGPDPTLPDLEPEFEFDQTVNW